MFARHDGEAGRFGTTLLAAGVLQFDLIFELIVLEGLLDGCHHGLTIAVLAARLTTNQNFASGRRGVLGTGGESSARRGRSNGVRGRGRSDLARGEAKNLSRFEFDHARFAIDARRADTGDAIARMQVALDMRSQFFRQLNRELFLLDFENQGLGFPGILAEKADEDAFQVEEARGNLLSI